MINIKLLSNVVIFPIVEILNSSLSAFGIEANIAFGAHNNLLQESYSQTSEQILIVFWELSQLSNNLCYLADTLNEDNVNEIISHTKNKIDLFFNNVRSIPIVIFNRFSCLAFNDHQFKTSFFTRIADAMNQHLDSNCPSNVKLINIDRLLIELGIKSAYDWRFFMLASSPYTQLFYTEYVNKIIPTIIAQFGIVKKALIFDCDNTLWGGIVGEAGIDGIQLSFSEKQGIPYAAVQVIAHSLSSLGVIIGLCSKNNPEDVNKVFTEHPNSILKEDDITIKMINWNDKVTNIKSISKKLNISLNSLVYIDDSDFEVNYIKNSLPEVTVLQVPKNRSEYPSYLCRKIRSLFLLESITIDDINRKLYYKNAEKRDQEKEKFTSLDDYLASLKLSMNVYVNRPSDIKRAQQLCSRTNQFNLSQKRYTENEIETFMNSSDYNIYTFDLQDKFGDYGISGLAILKYENEIAVIDTFLMSCRVIGRNAEFAFFNALIDTLKNTNRDQIMGHYTESEKNRMAKNFYSEYNMTIASKENGFITYSSKVSDLSSISTSHIEVHTNYEL